MKKQPNPKKNNNPPIVDLVVKDMLSRKKLGKKRYGVFLQAENGRNALLDAYEEALDMCMYLKQKLEEETKVPQGMAYTCISPHSGCGHQQSDCVLVPGGSARNEQSIEIRDLLNKEYGPEELEEHKAWAEKRYKDQYE